MKPHFTLPYQIALILMVILFPSAARGECDTLFYMHRLNLPGASGAFKLECIDSLLASKKGGRDSLLVRKNGIAYDLGRFGTVVQTYEQLGDKGSGVLSQSQRLELQLHYIHSLYYTKRYRECISQCMEMLHTPKPDSLRYYDTLADCMLVGFDKQASPVQSQQYIARNEALLRQAESEGWPATTVDNIKYGYYSMLMHDSSCRGDFEKALVYADHIVPLHISESRRKALDTNIAYIYLMLGKYGEAEEGFGKLLEEGEASFNKGVTLLNYTHMLNQQGRYAETLAVLDKYEAVARCLDQDIYSSYLLANKAVAEARVKGYPTAFATLLRSKELGDSIVYGSGLQDGLLMLEYTEQAAMAASLREQVKQRKQWTAAVAVAAALLLACAVWLGVLLRRRRDENRRLAALLSESRKKEAEAERSYTELAQAGDSKAAAQMLHAATVEDTLVKIEDVMRGSEADDAAKLKLIEKLVSSSGTRRDSREQFEHHFEQAHAEFFKKLYAVHPNLTPGEVRMCAYVIMNLSNKEIAAVTNKSVRSVESSRYRIGKKMEVQEGESVVSYLRRFLS